MTSHDRKRAAELRGRGYSQAEIAKALGCSVRTVRRMLATPGAAEVSAAVQAEVEPGAVATLRELLSSDNELVRLGAARALLSSKVPDSDVGTSGGTQIHVYEDHPDRRGRKPAPPPDPVDTAIDEALTVETQGDETQPDVVVELFPEAEPFQSPVVDVTA